MGDHLIGRRDQGQGFTALAQLAARLPPTRLARAARAALQAVTGWRFVAVLGDLPAQFLILDQESGHLLAQLGHEGFAFGNPLVWRHASMLHLHGKTD